MVVTPKDATVELDSSLSIIGGVIVVGARPRYPHLANAARSMESSASPGVAVLSCKSTATAGELSTGDELSLYDRQCFLSRTRLWNSPQS